MLKHKLLAPPAARSDTKVPLILFLHGAGQRGDDNQSQLIHGVPDLSSEESRRRFPHFLLAPQCPAGQRWVDTDWEKTCHRQTDAPSEPLRLSLLLLAEVMSHHPIDASRVYLTGLSMGGFGVFDLLSRRPDLFAAAVAVCGGGDVSTASRFARVPLWIFHGARDETVPVECSRQMVDALRRKGGQPRYTEYPDVHHDAWTRAYREPGLLPWLFAQHAPP